jgi:hypothetical protein
LFKKASANNSDKVLPSPAFDQAGHAAEATFVVNSTTAPSATANPRDRTRNHHRVSKKPKQGKKGESSPKFSSTNRRSREPSTMLEESGTSMNHDQLSYAYQAQTYSGSSLISTVQQPALLYEDMQSTAQRPQPSGPSQTGELFNTQDVYQMTYSSQVQAGYSVGYSSRVEDIARSPNITQDSMDPNHPFIRSQYIIANQDAVWRATR